MTNNSANTYLKLPVSARDHIRGSLNALVTLVEYGDYECPHCRYAYPIVEQVQRWFTPAHLRFVFRHFPLTQLYNYAQHAAETAEAAGAQGQFWKMHELLFVYQQQLSSEFLAKHADTLKLDTAKMVREVAAGVYKKRVQEDFTRGVQSGVNGTPTFFINGIRHDKPYDFDKLLVAIEDIALREQGL